MEEKKGRFPLSIYEVVLLVIAIPFLFYYTEKLLWTLGEAGGGAWWLSWFLICLGYLLDNPWNPLGPLIILGFDCLWVIAMMYGPLKNLRIKVYATLIVFTISAAILTMWVMGNLFRGWIPS